ncbi:MAG: MFS transporter [Caulobacterales bacterium]|jgi:MFS family permease
MSAVDSPGDAPWPPRRAAWTAVAILALANFFAFIDRILMSLLIQPIKVDWNLTDTEASLLLGLAFGLFYTLLAIPIGRLVDGWSRKSVAALGLAFWSMAAVACGAAHNFVQLFIARVGVGAGEASLNPASYSILSDYFPKRQLSSAIGIYTMAAFLGAGVALIGGGYVLRAFTAHGPFDVPMLGQLAPWQMTFVVLAAPGLVVALLCMMIKEPARRGAGEAQASFGEAMRFMRTEPQRWAFFFLIAAFAVHTFGSYAGSGWTLTFFIRTFGWSPQEAGLYTGLTFLIFGAGGALAGGWYGDRLRQRGHLDAQLRAAQIGIWISWPMGLFSTLVPDAAAAVALNAGAMFFSTFVYPLAASAIQTITPNRMRGQASAVYLTVINLVGLGLGPLVIGMLNDYGFKSPQAIGLSLAIVNGITPPLMAVLLALGLKHYRAAVAASEAQP